MAMPGEETAMLGLDEPDGFRGPCDDADDRRTYWVLFPLISDPFSFRTMLEMRPQALQGLPLLTTVLTNDQQYHREGIGRGTRP